MTERSVCFHEDMPRPFFNFAMRRLRNDTAHDAID